MHCERSRSECRLAIVCFLRRARRTRILLQRCRRRDARCLACIGGRQGPSLLLYAAYVVSGHSQHQVREDARSRRMDVN